MIDSPVNSILKKLIHFDKTNASPIYIQIAQQIINAVQRTLLVNDTLLPGTRTFSQLININRNTAVAVYDELASQGWVKIIANKGTIIQIPEQKTATIKAGSNQMGAVYNIAEKTGFPIQTSFNLASTQEFFEAKYEINDGQPDLRLHPIHEFSKWYASSMKRKSLISKWNNNKKIRYSIFENQLCNYLNATRGLHIKPTNVISTRSTEMGLYIISQLIIQKKDIVLVGDLSNYAANMIFQQSGAIIKTIPRDAHGINIDFIKTHFTKGSIRCIYLCANRDYPTTILLSAERRLKLLQLAIEYQFAIIEDDFDYDYQFDGLAALPMASSDENGMVIYLGKLGQSLFPNFQTGFVVAPENLISEAKNYLQILDRQGDLIQEQMLSELIYEGEIHRLLKKNIVIYKKRRDFMCHCLEENFKNILKFKKPTGGLALWIEFTSVIPLVQLSENALKYDLFLPKTILYQDKDTCAIRLGFGHLNEEEIEIIVKKFKQAYELTIK